MDIRAQRHHKIADLLAHAVFFGAFQIDRNGCRRRLGAQRGGIARNLIADERQRIFVADQSGNGKLNGDAQQVHQDDHQEHLPQNAQNGEGLARFGHVGEGAADVKRQQRDDDRVQHLIDDAGKVLHAVVQRVADLLAAHGRQAQAKHKGQRDRRQRVQQRCNGQTEIGFQRIVGRGGDLLHRLSAHEMGKEFAGHQIGTGPRHERGAIGECDRDEQQASGAAAQVGDAHGDIGHDHQRDDKFQEGAEDAGCGNHNPADAFGKELSNEDA